MTDIDAGASRARTDVYAYLRAKIMDLQLPPDSKVNIDALSRELGVSPTPVREALHQLEGDNLIVKTPGKGYYTTPLLGFTELRELFELRLLIEPWAARAAAVNRLSNPGRVLDTALQDFAASPRHQLVSHDVFFHEQILRAGRNKFAHQALAATHCHLHLYRLYPVDWAREQTVEEHRTIQEAIHNVDPDAAETAMHDHLMGAYHRFAQAFAERDDPGPRPSISIRLV